MMIEQSMLMLINILLKKIENGQICMPCVSTDEQIANILTKGPPKKQFETLIGKFRKISLSQLEGSVGKCFKLNTILILRIFYNYILF